MYMYTVLLLLFHTVKQHSQLLQHLQQACTCYNVYSVVVSNCNKQHLQLQRKHDYISQITVLNAIFIYLIITVVALICFTLVDITIPHNINNYVCPIVTSQNF